MMNRYMVWFIGASLLAFASPVAGQVGARIDLRNGRIGVGLAVGGLHVRVAAPSPVVLNRVVVHRAPVRIRMDTRRQSWHGSVLQRQDLRYLLGKDQVKAIERHARSMRVRGRTEGRWVGMGRWARVLEVTVGGIPVAELHDYRSDGFFDEIIFLRPRW